MNEVVGRWISWLVLGSVIVCALTATLRYVFNVGFVWMQELYVALFALNFTLAAGYAYRLDQHVRIDIYLNRMTARSRAWVEGFGVVIFLIPWLGVVVWSAIPFIALSWRIFEPSNQSGGLPGFFIFKSVILVFVLFLGLQGLAVLGRSLLVILEQKNLLPDRQVSD